MYVCMYVCGLVGPPTLNIATTDWIFVVASAPLFAFRAQYFIIVCLLPQSPNCLCPLSHLSYALTLGLISMGTGYGSKPYHGAMMQSLLFKRLKRVVLSLRMIVFAFVGWRG